MGGQREGRGPLCFLVLVMSMVSFAFVCVCVCVCKSTKGRLVEINKSENSDTGLDKCNCQAACRGCCVTSCSGLASSCPRP